MRRQFAELSLEHAGGLRHFVARFVGRQLGEFVVMHRVGAERTQRFGGKAAQLRPVHDQLPAMGSQIEIVLAGQRTDQVDAIWLRHGPHALVDDVEGLVLFRQRRGWEVVGLAAIGHGDCRLLGDDVLERLPPHLPYPVNERRRDIERERALVPPHDGQRVPEVVAVAVVEGEDGEGTLGLIGLDPAHRLVQADRLKAELAHAADHEVEEVGLHLQDRIRREIGGVVGQDPVQRENHAAAFRQPPDDMTQLRQREGLEQGPDGGVANGRHRQATSVCRCGGRTTWPTS